MLLKAYVETPEKAWSAQALGVPGIYRAEPALLAPDRIALMRSVILAEDAIAHARAVEALLPLHMSDLKTIFRILSGDSITIRLLDPPLERFLPTSQQIAADYAEARSSENYDELFTLSNLSHRVSHARARSSVSHRGCRLSLTHPSILRLQVAAALEAVMELEAEAGSRSVTFLVPLVSSEEEIRVLTELVHEIATDVFSRRGRMLSYRLGAMIESPRAAICAAEISDHVDIVAFGTNDLTRLTYGFTEEDIAAYFDCYLERDILSQNPFIRLDQRGVGRLMKDAVRAIRQHKPTVEIGICGDHSADPESLEFFDSLGASFVACRFPFIEQTRHSVNELSAA